MRVTILRLALLDLASFGAAESMKVGSYNVSFNMSPAHENVVRSENSIPKLIIKTFDGWANVMMAPTNDTAEDAINLLARSSDNACVKSYIMVDGTPATSLIMGGENPSYNVAYPLDNDTCVGIASGLPLFRAY